MQAKETYPKVYTDTDRYLSVIEADDGRPQPYILLVKQNDTVVSMLIGYISDSRIKCNLGRKTLFQPSLRRLSVVYGGVLGNPGGDILDLLIDQLMSALRSCEVDVVFFDHLETDSLLYRYARSKPNFICRNFFSKVETHWRISLPDGIELFYQRLSTKHRSNLRRLVRRIEKECANNLNIVRYYQEKDVDKAVRDAFKISSTTYQYSYGGGINDINRTKSLWSAAAKLGFLQVDILYINNEPCSFQFGLKYRSTYFGEKIGFNPVWGRFRVGTVLFLKIMESMCADSTFRYYDFGFSHAEYKQHYGNEARPEASFFIFAPRFVPILTNLIFSITLAASSFVAHAAKKLGLFDLVQKYRRSLAMRRADIIKPSI